MKTEATTQSGPRKRIVGGKTCAFRSTWEENWARRLEWLKRNRAIADWEHEPHIFKFPIDELPAQRPGPTQYTPDFRITNNDGSVHYEEIKGRERGRGQTQIKRMAKFHPDVELRVVGEDEYREAMRVFGGLIAQVTSVGVPGTKRTKSGVPEHLEPTLAAHGVTAKQYLRSGLRRRS